MLLFFTVIGMQIRIRVYVFAPEDGFGGEKLGSKFYWTCCTSIYADVCVVLARRYHSIANSLQVLWKKQREKNKQTLVQTFLWRDSRCV